MAQIEFSQKGIDQLNESMSELTKSMKSLDSSLAALSRRRSVFSRVFGESKDFEAISAAMNKLSDNGVNSFRVLSGAVADLVKSIKDYRMAANSLGNVGRFFNSLNSLASLEDNADNLRAGMAQAGRVIEELVEKSKLIDKEVVHRFNALGTALSGIARISRIDYKEMDEASKYIKPFLRSINDAGLNQKNLDALASSLKELRVIFQSISAIVREAPKGSDVEDATNPLGLFGREIWELSRILQPLASRGEGSDLTKVLAGMLDGLTYLPRAMGRFSKAMSRAGLNRLRGGGKAGVFQPIVDILNGMAALDKAAGQVRNKQDMRRILSPIAALINAMKEMPDIKVSRLPFGRNDTAKLSRSIRVFVKNISNIVKDISEITSIKSFTQVGEAFSKFITSFNTVLESVQKTRFPKSSNIIANRRAARQMTRYFDMMWKVLKGMAQIADRFAKRGSVENLDKVSTIFDRLGRSFEAVIKADDHVKSTRRLKINDFLRQLKPIFATLNKIGVKRNADYSGFAVALRSVIEGIRKLGSDSLKTADKKSLQRLKESAQIVALVLNSLSRVRLTNLPNIGPMIAELANLPRKLKGTEISAKFAKDLKVYFKELVRAVQSLDRLKIRARTLRAIENTVKAFRDLREVKDLRIPDLAAPAQRLGVDTAENVRKGVFRAGLQLALVKVVVDAFSSINPLALSRNLVNGFQAVSRSIVRVVNSGMQQLRNLGNQVRQLGREMMDVGRRMFNEVGVLGLMRSSAVQTAVNFDDLSNQIRVFGDLTADQLSTAESFANQIGIDYPQSSNEAMEAMLNLVKAGLDMQQVYNTMPAAADLSAISDTRDIDRMSEGIIMVTQSFKAFSEEVEGSFENSDEVANIFARAANASTSSVESLLEGVGNVGPVADQFGMTLEETVAVMALFQESGIDGAEAGTQLRSMLNGITRATPAVQRSLRELGVSLTDEQGNFRSLNDIVNDLNTSMSEATTVQVPLNNATAANTERMRAAQRAYARAHQQYLLYRDGLTTGSLDEERAQKKMREYQRIMANAEGVMTELTGSQAQTEYVTREITRSQAENFQTLQQLAGSYGQAGLSILLGQGEDGIQSFIETMNGMPTAADQAREMLDSMRGDVEQLSGSVESLVTRAILPLIDRAFRPLVKVARFVVDAISALPDPIFETFVNAGFLVSVLATVAGGALLVTGVVTTFGGALLSLAGTLGGLLVNTHLVLGGVLAFGGALATLIAAATVLVPLFLGVSSALTTFARAVEGNVGGAGDAFERMRISLSGIASAIGGILQAGTDIFGQVFGSAFNRSSVETGERIAGLLDNLTDKFEAFRRKAQGASDVLDAFSVFLLRKESGGSLVEYVSDTAEAMAFMRDETYPSIRVMRDLDAEMESAIETLRKNPIGKLLFKGMTNAEIISKFNEVSNGLEYVRDNLSNIVPSLTTLLFSEDDTQKGLARSQLKRSVSSLASIIARGFQNATGVDMTESILQFDARNVREGAEAFVNALIRSIQGQLLLNRDEIVGFLSNLFSYLVPGRALINVAEMLGMTNLADTLSGAYSQITNFLRQIVGTAFDVITGSNLRQAIEDNFGADADSALGLLDELQTFGDELGRLIDGVVGALFPGGNTEGKSVLAIAMEGITVAFRLFNNWVLRPLRVFLPPAVSAAREFVSLWADNDLSKQLIRVGIGFAGVATALKVIGRPGLANAVTRSIGSIVGALRPFIIPAMAVAAGVLAIKNALSNLNTLLQGDIGGFIGDTLGGIVDDVAGFLGLDISSEQIATFASNLATGIQQAIQSVPDLLVELGANFGLPVLTRLGEALSDSESLGETISALAQSLSNLVLSAIQSVGTGLTGLGESFGSPLLTALGDSLEGANLIGAIAVIGSAIGSVVTSAIQSIPSALVDLGQTFGAPLLVEIGETLRNPSNAASVIELIGQSLADIVRSGIQGIGGWLTTLGEDFASPLLIQIGASLQNLNLIGAVSVIATAIGNAVLSAIQAVPAALINLGNTFGIPLLSELGASLQNTESFSGVIVAMAHALANVVKLAIQGVGTLLVGMGETFGVPLLAQMGASLQGLNVIGAVSTMALAIGNLVLRAIQAVPGALIDLGTSFGDPLIVALGTGLQTATTGEEAITSLRDFIADWVQRALGSVPARLQELGATLDLDFLSDIGISLQESVAFNMLVTGLSNLVAFPVDALSSIVGGLERLFAVFQEQGLEDMGTLARNMSLLAGAVGLFAYYMKGAALGSFLLRHMAGGFSLLKTNLIPVAGSLAMVGTAVLLVKNAISNLYLIAQGDVVGFIRETLYGMASDILGFFGMEVSSQELINSLSTSLLQVAFLFERSIRDIRRRVEIAFRNLIDAHLRSVLDAVYRVDNILNPNGRGAVFFEIQGVIESDMDFNEIGERLVAEANNAETLESLRILLRTEYIRVMDAFKEEIPALSDMSDVDFGNMVRTLSATDALDDALRELDPSAIGDFLQRAMETAPDALSAPDWTNLINGLFQDASIAGGLDPELFRQILFSVPDDAISPEDKERIFNELRSALGFQETLFLEIDAAINRINTAESVSAIPEEEFQNLLDQVLSQDALDTAIANMDIPTATDFIQRIFDSNPEDAAEIDYSALFAGLAESGVPEEQITAVKNRFIAELFNVSSEDISPEDRSNLQEAIREAYTAALSGAGGETAEPLEVETPITPNPVIDSSPEAFMEYVQAGADAFMAQAMAEAANLEAELPVDLQFQTPQMPVQVASEAEAVAFTEKVQTLRSELSGSSEEVATLSNAIATLNTVLLENTANMLATWQANMTPVETSSATIKANVSGIQRGIMILSGTMATVAPIIVMGANMMAVAFENLANRALGPLNEVAKKLHEINFMLSSVRSAKDVIDSSPVGAGDIPGRAMGGPVFADRLYEVGEGGRSELLRIGNRTYLIPGQNGTVVPAMASPRSAMSGAASHRTMNHQTVNVHVTINGNATQADVQSGVANGLREAGINPVNRRLMIAGRT